MKKIRIIEGENVEILEAKANHILEEIKTDDVDIKYMYPECVIILEYVEHLKVCKCVDCQFFDKDGDIRGAWGLCHRKGIRERFNSDACECFEDIRGVEQ